MRRRRRTIFLAALALTVPLPAYALTQSTDEAGSGGPVELEVNAALDSCGTSGSQVLCAITVAFNPIPGATRYTASITGADGSVTDAGEIGPGSTIYTPYVGNGTYGVRVDAYGNPPEPAGKPELIETDAAEQIEAEGKATLDGGAGNNSKNELEVEVGARSGEAEEPKGSRSETEIEAVCEPAPEPPPSPELTPEEQAAVDADRERVAAGKPSELDPELAAKVAEIEAAEAAHAEAAHAEAAAAPPCPAP